MTLSDMPKRRKSKGAGVAMDRKGVKAVSSPRVAEAKPFRKDSVLLNAKPVHSIVSLFAILDDSGLTCVCSCNKPAEPVGDGKEVGRRGQVIGREGRTEAELCVLSDLLEGEVLFIHISRVCSVYRVIQTGVSCKPASLLATCMKSRESPFC